MDVTMKVDNAWHEVQYRILDPTGNVTALVESSVPVADQPSVGKAIMSAHPEVEQVGFVRYWDKCDEAGAHGELRMAGGEFCGNATMCAAALYLSRMEGRGSVALSDGLVPVTLHVSGASHVVEVCLHRESKNSFRAGVRMPPAMAVEDRSLSFESMSGQVTVVRMEGISHVVIRPDSPLFSLPDERSQAERAARFWCRELQADGLGLMFLEGEGSTRTLTPLVFVPGSDTVFWESSCASGSAATGMALASEVGSAVDVNLHEPGGVLRVSSDPVSGQTWLYGNVRLGN